MEETKRGTAMERLAALIVDRRNILFLLFLLAGVFCMISRNWVEVRDSLTDYLPENTETRQGLDLMDREFVTYATAELMVENVTYEEAERLSAEIGQIYGVSSVKFDDTEAHYTSSSALFSLTFAGRRTTTSPSAPWTRCARASLWATIHTSKRTSATPSSRSSIRRCWWWTALQCSSSFWCCC